MTDSKPASSAKPNGARPAGTAVADLGSRSRKSIKKLLEGDGRLLEDVNSLLELLKTESVVTGPTRAVVVVVKEKRRGMTL